MSRSVKNASNVGASALMTTPRGGLEADGCEGKQLGGRRQVPVGVGRVDVAEVGRQRREAGLDVDAVPVPADQGRYGEAVPEVVRPGPAGGRAWGEACLAPEPEERQAKRTKAEEKALKGMVRRTCKQCGHEWVIPKKLIKASKQAGAAAILGSPVASIAYGRKGVDMGTCAQCGSVGFFSQTDLVRGP